MDLHDVDTDALLAELQRRNVHTDTEHLLMILAVLKQKPMYSDPTFVEWYRTLEDVWITIMNQRNKNAIHPPKTPFPHPPPMPFHIDPIKRSPSASSHNPNIKDHCFGNYPDIDDDD